MRSIREIFEGSRERLDEYLAQFERDERGWKHQTKELLLPLFGIGMYATPGFLNYYGVLNRTVVMFPLLVAGLVTFTATATKSGKEIPERKQASINPTDLADDEAIEVLTTEYEQIAEEARYRDELLTHTNYFAFATFALLANVMLNVSAELQSVIAMGSSIIAFGFVISVNGLKDSRDQLWIRLKQLETKNHIQRTLSVFHTVDNQGRRRLFNRFSFSSFSIIIQTLLLFFWIAVYATSVVN